MSAEDHALALVLAHRYFATASAIPPAERQRRIWHSPFMILDAGASGATIETRLIAAGRLWLANPDVGSTRQLIIDWPARGLSYLFQRAQQPDHNHVEVGPIGACLLSSKGEPLYATHLFHAETDMCWAYEHFQEVYRRQVLRPVEPVG